MAETKVVMASKSEKIIRLIFIYAGMFLALLAMAVAFLALLASIPHIGVDAVGRKITIITAHEKMIVSVVLHSGLFLTIAASAAAILVLQINMRRRLDRLSRRVQDLTQALQTQSAAPAAAAATPTPTAAATPTPAAAATPTPAAGDTSQAP